ncbi:MAG: HEAT repeat domain-containing protein [Alphaproteobacteria bacterium]|nr:HEAT repeat domain-containing protein [Alphaproteobacteria bacterium]MCB9793486.1 HEAT repeat domain-containing protein [Alphaproteobacteria bacterium]
MAREATSSMPPGPGGVARDRTLVREIFANMVKFARTARIYGADHPNVRRFRGIYHTATHDFLRTHEWLEAELDGEQLSWQGVEMLGPNTTAAAMAAELFAEGVRTIGFHRGVTEEELERLAELLTSDWRRRSEFEEDLVASLWRAEFEHVHVDVASRFSQSDDQSLDALRADALGGRKARGEDLSGDSIQLQELESLMEQLRAGERGDHPMTQMKQDEAELLNRLRAQLKDPVEAADEDEELVLIDPLTRAQLEEELLVLARGEDCPIEDMGQVFFELLVGCVDGQGAMEIGAFVAAHALDQLERGHPEVSSLLLARCLAALDEDLFPHFYNREAFRQGYSRALLKTGARARLVNAIQRNEDKTRLRGALFTMLAGLSHDLRADLVSLCAELPDADSRQVAADTLLLMLEQDEEQLIKMVDSSREAGAVGPLLALSRISAPQAIGACMARVRDADARVREAALRSLRGQRSPGVKRVMVEALADPEKDVRVEALRYLAVHRDAAQVPDIEEHLKSKDFPGGEPEELRAWFFSYALIGRATSLSLLRQVALGKLTIHGAPEEEAVGLALSAIHRVGTPAAKKLLGDLAKQEPRLADAIRRAGGGAQ